MPPTAQAAPDPLDDESFATEKEASLIEELRGELEPELSKLKTEGNDFPHTTGDIFMLRVLRGMDCDIKKATEWYRKMVAVRKEHGMDAIYKKSAAAGMKWKPSELPHADKILGHYNVHFDEDGMKSLNGHLIWYDTVGDVNATEILKIADDFKEFYVYLNEVRLAVMDRMSREKGHLVKTVRIMDAEGYAPWKPKGKEMMKLFRGFIFPMIQNTSIEALHRVYIINTSWFAKKAYQTIAPLMRERVRSRIRPLGRDYAKNEELLQNVSGSILSNLVATRNDDGESGKELEGTMRLILAGRIMGKSAQVQSGQKVSWQFCMGSANEADEAVKVRGTLGKLIDKGLGETSDVTFSVSFWPEEERDCADMFSLEKVLVEPSTVDAKMGEVTGSIEAPGAGTLVLQWSNYQGWVRAKLVSSYKISVE